MPIVPFKLNQDRRHHIPRQQRKVTNWPAYDASLRQRGSLTGRFTEEAVDAWAAEPRTTRGGQPWYSELAILTALTLRAVFRLSFRQTEGLIGSIIGLLGLTLRVPDHTTLSRRAATLEVPRPRSSSSPDAGGEAEPVHLLVDSTGLKLCGPGEWLLEKHGTKTRRSWRKLHLGVDADTGQRAELCPVNPDAVHDHGQPPRQGDNRLLLASVLGHLHAPGPQPRPSLSGQKQDLGSLVEHGTGHAIAAQRHSPNPVGLARLVLDGRQPEGGAHRLGFARAAR